MTQLFSLGDSFMTVDDPSDGIVGFCELYCQQRGFEHVSLARPGATNFSIRLQIEQAIAESADYVVIGLTSSDRFNIVTNPQENYQLCNVHYTGYRARSQQHVEQHNVCMVSDTFNNIISQQHQQLVSEFQLNTLRRYIADLHDPGLASQQDYYVVSDGLRKLLAAGIEFVLIPGWLSQHDWSWAPLQWPKNCNSPYQMPYGSEGWERPIRFTNTHNPAWAHEEFCATLMAITKHWD